jgi:serine/threonine protein kinase
MSLAATNGMRGPFILIRATGCWTNGGGSGFTDFGLARIEADPRMTLTGNLVGTLRYMSPQQAPCPPPITRRGQPALPDTRFLDVQIINARGTVCQRCPFAGQAYHGMSSSSITNVACEFVRPELCSTQ